MECRTNPANLNDLLYHMRKYLAKCSVILNPNVGGEYYLDKLPPFSSFNLFA